MPKVSQIVGGRAGGLKQSWSGSKAILLALVLVGLPIDPHTWRARTDGRKRQATPDWQVASSVIKRTHL